MFGKAHCDLWCVTCNMIGSKIILSVLNILDETCKWHLPNQVRPLGVRDLFKKLYPARIFFFWKNIFEKYFFISKKKKKSFVQNNKMMLPKTTKRTCVSTAAETWCKMDDSQEMITWIWKTPLTLHQVCDFHNKTTPLPALQQKNDVALLTQHHAARRISFGKKSFENENASGLLENCYNFLGPCRNITSCETKLTSIKDVYYL